MNDKKSASVHPNPENLKAEFNAILKKNEQLQSKIDVISNQSEKRKETVERQVERNQKLQESIKKLREANATLRSRIERTRPFFAVNRYLEFMLRAREHAEQLQSDVYVAHGVQALPAAHALAHETSGKFASDVIEVPSFLKRVVPSAWDRDVTTFLDFGFESYLRQCDFMMTVGPSLAGEISGFGPPVTVIQNYRWAEERVKSDKLREWCGLAPDDRLLLCLSLTVHGFEDVLDALLKLPPNIHLATMGRFAPKEYAEAMRELAQTHPAAKRVHLFDAVPYKDLTSIASGADVGLIVRDPSYLNNRVSLPNRIFDYMFSGVPVCVSSEITDIIDIVREYDMGAPVQELSADGWAAAITEVLSRSETMKANALAASKVLTWESREPVLFEALQRPTSVCFMGVNDLRKNNRTLRMAQSLAAKGVKVNILTCGKPDEDFTCAFADVHVLDI